MLLLSYIVKKLSILYEDKSVIVIDKPAALAVQGGKGVKSSVDKILAEMQKTAGNTPPLLVHRLDKDTSGVLLAAKDREAAALFSRFLGGRERKAIKQYIAVCAGCFGTAGEGVIKLEIPVHEKMKKSETKYKVIKNGVLADVKFSVLELELGTGRMHQIRRHLAMIGHPVLGDDKYGDFPLNKKMRKLGHKRLLLHASRLVIKEHSLDIRAPLPEYFNPFT